MVEELSHRWSSKGQTTAPGRPGRHTAGDHSPRLSLDRDGATMPAPPSRRYVVSAQSLYTCEPQHRCHTKVQHFYWVQHNTTHHSGLFTRPSASTHSTLTLQGSPGSGSTQVSPSPSIPAGQDSGQGPPQSIPASPPFISAQQCDADSAPASLFVYSDTNVTRQ